MFLLKGFFVSPVLLPCTPPLQYPFSTTVAFCRFAAHKLALYMLTSELFHFFRLFTPAFHDFSAFLLHPLFDVALSDISHLCEWKTFRYEKTVEESRKT